jgi:hypothetical protein
MDDVDDVIRRACATGMTTSITCDGDSDGDGAVVPRWRWVNEGEPSMSTLTPSSASQSPVAAARRRLEGPVRLRSLSVVLPLRYSLFILLTSD